MKNPCEVADIFSVYGKDYQKENLLSYKKFKVMNHITVCRTAQLGGHIEQCDQCGFERIEWSVTWSVYVLSTITCSLRFFLNSPGCYIQYRHIFLPLKTVLKDDRIQKKLDAIDRNIDRAAIIAKELLQFSQTQETILLPMDVNQVLNSAISHLNDKFDNIKVTLQQEEDLSIVELNAAKLEQVFLNVINNAIEAMEGNGKLFIKTKQANKEVHIVVSDNDTGISQEQLLKIFDPFFTTKETNSGTGLGLSISHGIIEQHRGSIKLINNKTGGVDTIIILGKPPALPGRLPEFDICWSKYKTSYSVNRLRLN
jgi:signal transduction histidine kinase